MEDGEIEGNQVTLDLSNLRVKVASGIEAETEVALKAEVDLVAETREVFEVEEASEEEEEQEEEEEGETISHTKR